MKPETITEFRRRVVSEKDLGAVMNYFFDHLACDHEFLASGHQLKVIPDTIQEVVGNVAGAVLKTTVLAITYNLIDVPEHQFLHGHMMINGRQATIVWLPDAQAGVVSINKNFKTGETVSARISICPAVTDKRKAN